MAIYTLEITPIPAPRLNRKSRFNPAKKAMWERYMNFKGLLFILAQKSGFDFSQESLAVTFILPMPKSWSQKKRQRLNGQPHKQRPDLDNMLKAVKDSLYKEDKRIWHVCAEKRWGVKGQIILRQEVTAV